MTLEELQRQSAETIARIAKRTDAYTREQEERLKALAWCRANGNPHLKEEGEPINTVGPNGERL